MSVPQVELPAAEVLTRREAADLLKVHTETIKRWQRQGRLRAFVLSPTVVRYRRADLEQLLQGCAHAARHSTGADTHPRAESLSHHV